MAQIQWIGTGSGLNIALGNTSFLVKNENKTLLVDCGFSVTPELLKSGQLKNVTDIVITHNHSDHIGGLESLAFMSYFVFKKREEERPNLYVGSEAFAYNLWEHSLSGGLIKMQTDENIPFDATLETFFKVNVEKKINIPSLPQITLFSTLHVQGMENYGLWLGNDVFYSGDTVELPKAEGAKLIFQDCQFYETPSDVHIFYGKLKKELPSEVKSITYLVHLGGGWDKKDPKADGFAGFVKPGEIFEF